MDLEAFWTAIEEVENPVRRSFHEIVALSGTRPTALTKAEWRNLDEDRRILTLEHMKNGEPFHMPLSEAMLSALARTRLDDRWVFPASTPTGHISNYSEKVLPCTHKALRHNYTKTCEKLNIPLLKTKMLMAHKLPKSDVTAGYMNLDELAAELVPYQEEISTKLLESIVTASS